MVSLRTASSKQRHVNIHKGSTFLHAGWENPCGQCVFPIASMRTMTVPASCMSTEPSIGAKDSSWFATYRACGKRLQPRSVLLAVPIGARAAAALVVEGDPHCPWRWPEATLPVLPRSWRRSWRGLAYSFAERMQLGLGDRRLD